MSVISYLVAIALCVIVYSIFNKNKLTTEFYLAVGVGYLFGIIVTVFSFP